MYIKSEDIYHFREYLIREEKAEETIEKYIREIKNFYKDFKNSDIGKEDIVKYKNKMLAKFINEKLAGKVENKQLFIDGDAEDPIAVPLDLEPETGFSEKDDLSPDEVVESREEEDENKKIFKELNRIVVQDQLYLSPELSREDLAQIVHLNNARFARMIKENTGTNFNGYINELRINYAIQLLKQHPNYTIRAIADEAGVNSTPILYSMFKKKTY